MGKNTTTLYSIECLNAKLDLDADETNAFMVLNGALYCGLKRASTGKLAIGAVQRACGFFGFNPSIPALKFYLMLVASEKTSSGKHGFIKIEEGEQLTSFKTTAREITPVNNGLSKFEGRVKKMMNYDLKTLQKLGVKGKNKRKYVNQFRRVYRTLKSEEDWKEFDSVVFTRAKK